MSATIDRLPPQAVTGLTPPQLREAAIRTVWPSVAALPGCARLGRTLLGTWILAPLAAVLMLPIYFMKILPWKATRYMLTNRRVMLCRGLKPHPTAEVALADISDVRLVSDENSAFFGTATLEIVSGGSVALRLPGVPGAESFRQAILNSCRAWVAVPKLINETKFVAASTK